MKDNRYCPVCDSETIRCGVPNKPDQAVCNSPACNWSGPWYVIEETPKSKLLHNLKIVTEQLRRIDAVTDDENPELSQDMLDALQNIAFNISEAEQTINKAEGEKIT